MNFPNLQFSPKSIPSKILPLEEFTVLTTGGNGAGVDQRLKYHYFYYAGSKFREMKWSGLWHKHYLE